jgi:hypothetical protein
VSYTAAERRVHELLQQYTLSRRRVPGAASARAGDLVTLVLKKRLFSSPAAFASTLQAHLDSSEGGTQTDRAADELPDWLAEAMEWDAEPTDDEVGSDTERELFDRLASLQPQSSSMEAALRAQLADWTEQFAEPADSKAKALIKELNRVCRPDGNWAAGERVIVFTEYVATQRWLAGLLDARGLGGERLGLLYGGMEERKREHLKAAFQADPGRDPLRILLATDLPVSHQLEHCHGNAGRPASRRAGRAVAGELVERDLPGLQEPYQGGPRCAQQAGGLASGQDGLMRRHGDRQALREHPNHVTQHLQHLTGQLQPSPVRAGQRRPPACGPTSASTLVSPSGYSGGSTVRSATTVMPQDAQSNEQNENG